MGCNDFVTAYSGECLQLVRHVACWQRGTALTPVETCTDIRQYLLSMKLPVVRC
jgi:hypothetical protein